MKPIIVLILLAIEVSTLSRATSSHAASARGMKEFEQKKYDAAAQAFAQAQEIRPSAQSAFNRGTAEIASGKASQGSATLAAALNDPRLRADALYNRGNSALTANAFEHAVRDYVEVLKLRPDDKSAKRNLEIALAKKKEQDKQNAGAGGKQQTPQNNQPQKQQQQPSAGSQQEQQPEQGSGPDAEALLRSVQQQEQEERRRMKAAGRDRQRVGW